MSDPTPAEYSERLANDDLVPAKQNWNWYNILCFWLSDVHSVGGYVFAASLFALGLAAWQVLVSLLVGIIIVQIFANMMGRPGQQGGVPFPVVCRLSFGVFGANIAAIIRGIIAVVWYGIQTYLASAALVVVLLEFIPSLKFLTHDSFLGLSYLGYVAFAVMWLLQAIVFWHGMSAIRRFIDWAGPAVYLVMFLLAGYMVWKAGWANIDFMLGTKALSGWDTVWQMVVAAALVAGYFAGPTLNFSDFTRYGSSFNDVRRGCFWGLPVNFLLFSIVTVIVVAATIPVFGEMITDPIATVAQIGHPMAAVLGALTFVIATIGINIVANFVSPAFDFSNAKPNKISWRKAGMIAAVASVFITPWNLFNNPVIIHYTIDMLAAVIGPLYGIVLTDYYYVKQRRMKVDDLFTEHTGGRYWYSNGFNWNAVKALVPATLVAILAIVIPGTGDLGHFSVFIGGLVGAGIYAVVSRHEAAAYRAQTTGETTEASQGRWDGKVSGSND